MEIVPQVIENAKENAKFIVVESETVIPGLYKKGAKADAIVVYPQ